MNTNPDIVILIGMILIRVLAVCGGITSLVLGWHLLIKGVFDRPAAGNLLWYKDKELIRRAAPGLVFAIFGGVVITMAAMTDMTFQKQDATGETRSSAGEFRFMDWSAQSVGGKQTGTSAASKSVDVK